MSLPLGRWSVSVSPPTSTFQESLQLGPGVTATFLDAFDRLVDHHPLPGVEHLLQECAPVIEVPVEPALGNAERFRQCLDADRVWTPDAERSKALFDPTISWGSKWCCHRLPRSTHSVVAAGGQKLTSHNQYSTVSIRDRMDRPMRLPPTAHTSRPWRIHELAHDFRVEDVWELPCRGGREDFTRLVSLIVAQNVSRSPSRAVRALFAVRSKLGALLGWDDAGAAARIGTTSLRDRLPVDLRNAVPPEFDALPFTSLYLLDDEFAAELANRTVHGVLHIGWVSDGTGGFRGQMAVLVKPHGMLGITYMQAIKPFRHRVVYPATMAAWERAWRTRPGRDAQPAQVA